jgi:hypothetical protein
MRYDDPNCNRIKLKTSDNGRHTGFVVESNDAGALGCIGLDYRETP